MLGVIVLAHGSRDPQWFGPIEAVAQAVAARASQSPVRCAYLELCGPSLLALVCLLRPIRAGSVGHHEKLTGACGADGAEDPLGGFRPIKNNQCDRSRQIPKGACQSIHLVDSEK